jgi:hypothetical protein
MAALAVEIYQQSIVFRYPAFCASAPGSHSARSPRPVECGQEGTDMQTVNLSESALALFRLHVERMGKIDVDDTNRQSYRELEAAGLVMNSRPFVGNQLYSLTRAGYELKLEMTCAKEAV